MHATGNKRGCLFVFAAIFALAVIVPCAGIIFWRSQGNAKLDAQFESMRAKGLPTNHQELDRAYTLPEDAEDTTQLWIAACEPFETESYGKAVGYLPVVGANGPSEIPAPGEHWAQHNAVDKLLQDYDESMQLMHAATDKGGYARFDHDFSQGYSMLLPNVQALRGGARMLQLEAHSRAHHQDAAGTFDSLDAMFTIGNALENDPILICQLVMLALDSMAIQTTIELLPHVDFTDAQLSELQKFSRRRDQLHCMRRSIAGEQAMALEAITGGKGFDDGASMPMMLSSSAEDMTMYLQLMNNVHEGMGKSWVESLDAAAGNETQLQSFASDPVQRIRYVRTTLMFPALNQAGQAGARGTAQSRMLDTILAAQRFKRAQGNYPKSIDELVPKFLPALPIDPYAGVPIQYSLDVEGLPRVWCVGNDRIDDGGVGDESCEPDVVLTLGEYTSTDEHE